MAQTAMTVRMDNQQKAQFDKLCEQFGMSANTAINIFVKAVIRSKSIPFSIQAKNEEEDEVTAKAKAAFQYMCDTARENNIDMSLDEINEEIREVRRLRKERCYSLLLCHTCIETQPLLLQSLHLLLHSLLEWRRECSYCELLP